MWHTASLTTIGVATATEARFHGLTPELSAYVRTELRGDASRIRAPRAPRPVGRSVGTRLRYWLNSFRGFAVLDVRGGKA